MFLALHIVSTVKTLIKIMKPKKLQYYAITINNNAANIFIKFKKFHRPSH